MGKLSLNKLKNTRRLLPLPASNTVVQLAEEMVGKQHVAVLIVTKKTCARNT